MNLNYKLSKKNVEACRLSDEEKIMYCLPIDIDRSGLFTDDAYTVITTKRILVLEKGELIKDILLADCDEVKSEPQIACGIIYVTVKGEKEIVGRFSARHLVRYSYVARGCRFIKEGKKEKVVSTEYEKTCPKCGRALPGTKECPKCAGRREGFIPIFMGMLKNHKKRLLVIIFLMLLTTFVTLFNPSVQRYLIDEVLINEEKSYSKLFICLALMFVLGFGVVILNAAKSYLCAKLGSIISMEQRQKLYDRIQLLSLSFIHDRNPGELMNRISQDTARVQMFMGDTFCNIFTVVILFVCLVVFMLILNWQLALVAFALTPFSVIFSVAYRKNIKRRFRMQFVKQDKVNGNLQDVISGIAVVKSYGQEKKESDYFNRTADEFAKVQVGNEVFFAIFYPIITFLLGAGIYLVTFFGGKLTIQGDMTQGELVQFINYSSLLFTYVGWLSNMPRMFMNMITSVERIGDVMNQEPTIFDTDKSVEHSIEGDITFENASFGYKSYEPVIENINLEVKKGEMIGLVGASGAGKSTIINLIMHLYEVDGGALLVDGINIKDIKLANYHSQIGVVLQETFLFNGTILNNISYARPNATYEEIITAAKMANAHDFILKMPDGYNTYVGEKGYNLSGGERQRIAIARAILNDPRLLILDEATASLDTESEYLIQKAIKRLTEGRTTFAIAHRLSTLKDADRLLVIDAHGIAEMGTHNELMEKKGIYYSLVKAQLDMQKRA